MISAISYCVQKLKQNTNIILKSNDSNKVIFSLKTQETKIGVIVSKEKDKPWKLNF